MRFLFLLLLSSCSLFFGSETPKSAKGKEYSIKYQSPDWIQKKDDRSDYVFENTKDGRIFLSNSFCEEFQDQPLEQLAQKTFRQIDKFNSGKGEHLTFHNREAYRVNGTGEVDGVKVALKLMNTRRNNCYFDFLAIDPKNSPKDDSFDAFLNSVEFK